MDAESCPSQETLRRLLLGKLEDSESVESHLDHCGTCVANLHLWLESDEFVQAVCAGLTVTGENSATVDAMIARVTKLGNMKDFVRRRAAPSMYGGMADLKSLLAPAESADEIGRIADFRVLRLLGVGGMGAVFEAEDTRLKRRVAIKLMHTAVGAKPDSAARFLREAQSAAALKHENVVTIYQIGTHRNAPFIAFELLEGETLENCLVREGRLCVADVVRIGRQIASGLAAAHARGLLHRDIKPANIWLEGPAPDDSTRIYAAANAIATTRTLEISGNESSSGSSAAGKVKILDFGIAKPTADPAALSLSTGVIGTPSYMAPEQASGERLSPQTDLYGLGVVMYRMACGRLPFQGSDVLSLLRSLALDVPTPVSELNPQMPRELAEIIDQSLAKSAGARPASAGEVEARLRSIERSRAAEPPAETSTRRAGPPGRGRRRWPVRPWAIAVVLVLIAVLPLFFSKLGAQVIRVVTNKGQVVIQLDDPSAEVTVKENHIVIQDHPNQREITLAAGDHKLEISVQEPTGRMSFGSESFTLSRGGKKTITANYEPTETLARHSTQLDGQNEKAKGAAASGDKPLTAENLAKSAQEISAKETPTTIAGSQDPNRAVASAVLAAGGAVDVQLIGEHSRVVRTVSELPAEKFKITGVTLQRPSRQAFDHLLPSLLNLDFLVALDLEETPITDLDLKQIKRLTMLSRLSLFRTSITDSGLADVAEMPKLDTLNLGATRVTDAGLAHLKGLEGLQSLYLSETAVSGAGLLHLKDLPLLRFLSLEGSKVTDAGLANLPSLKHLDFIVLSKTQIGDAGFAHLGEAKSLTYVISNDTKLTGAGLAHLKGLSKS